MYKEVPVELPVEETEFLKEEEIVGEVVEPQTDETYIEPYEEIYEEPEEYYDGIVKSD